MDSLCLKEELETTLSIEHSWCVTDTYRVCGSIFCGFEKCNSSLRSKERIHVKLWFTNGYLHTIYVFIRDGSFVSWGDDDSSAFSTIAEESDNPRTQIVYGEFCHSFGKWDLFGVDVTCKRNITLQECDGMCLHKINKMK